MDDHSYHVKSKPKKPTKKQQRKLHYQTLSKIGHSTRYDAANPETSASGTVEDGQEQHGMETGGDYIIPGLDTLLTDTDISTDDPDYFPTPSKRHMLESDSKGNSSVSAHIKVSSVTVPPSFFVGETDGIMKFVDQMNQFSKCFREECQGKLVPCSFRKKGLGGGIIIEFRCSGYGCPRAATFPSTSTIEGSLRTSVSTTLHVAMYLAGIHYGQLKRALGLGLGLQVLDPSNFYKLIETLYPHSIQMLQEMCDEAKEVMRSKPNHELGSFKRAVTTSDGCWLTRGYFSKNFTFHVKDFMSQALLYYVHLCQRGSTDIIAENLYPGTSKSCEGHAAEIAFKQAASDGMLVEVNWQDGDSSSEKAFHAAFPDKSKSKVMLCAGHAGRAHGKQLDVMAGQKQLSEGYKSKHRNKFPEVDKVVCVCHGKKHSKNCGCMSETFQRSARINHSFAILEAHEVRDPQVYVDTLHVLADHHAMDNHSWEGGQCSFHPQRSCNCGNCIDKDDIKCDGEPYKSKHPLTCPLHQLAYRIECYQRAGAADRIIHKDFGKGHSNLPETDHAIFARFRSKDLNIQRLHYVVSTNFALMQANMAWLTAHRGPHYHWILDVYGRLGLATPEDLIEACKKQVSIGEKNREEKKSVHCKELRIKMKQARVQEHEERKRWGKEQRVQHTYGDEDTADDTQIMNSDAALDRDAEKLLASESVTSDEGICIVTNTTAQKKCRCGSETHKRTSHKDCPLRSTTKPKAK